MTDLVQSSLGVQRTGSSGGSDGPARTARLLSGLAALSERAGRPQLDGERLLFVLGAVLVPLGFLAIGIAWYGVAGSGLVFEQLPYVVSGGIGGLALVIVGSALYACWWHTRSIREQREWRRELVEKNDALASALGELVAELRRLRGDGPTR